MRPIQIVLMATVLALLSTPGFGEDPPKFYKDTFPEHALQYKLEAEMVLVGENAQLDAKTRELIALGVAAQVPCEYCVYGHTKNAIAAGASEGEIREAVATAAHVRHWSTVLNGMAYDFESFKMEVDEMHAPK